jgi:hypothetical protein
MTWLRCSRGHPDSWYAPVLHEAICVPHHPVLYKLAFEACIQQRNDFASMQRADPEKPQWYNLLVLTPFGMDNPLLP